MRTPSGVGEGADPRVVIAAVALGLVALLVLAVLSWRAERPARGEVWFAEVPFADGTGSKDRPVLVLATRGSALTVARFTSRDRTARRDHRRVPRWLPGMSGPSWVDLHPITLQRGALRRRVAKADAALLQWYERESGRSTAA